MPLTRLVYYSRSTTRTRADFDAELDAIVAVTRRNNARAGITGALLTDGMNFLQVVEGRRPYLGDLLTRLFADPRHERIRIVDLRAVPERRFGDWGMYLLETGPFVRPAISELLREEADGADALTADELVSYVKLIVRHVACAEVIAA